MHCNVHLEMLYVRTKSSLMVALQLIHMDLKSKNVLLNGRKDLAKIADVGLSRIIQSTLGGQSSTPFGVGTFEYTAPEILLGRQCNEKARDKAALCFAAFWPRSTYTIA